MTRAKAVICEIIRLAGGSFQNKTNLYKAFWWSHVRYYQIGHVSRLTEWPIARMPEGPGIHRFEDLLAGLLRDRAIRVADLPIGDFVASHFVINEPELYGVDFNADEVTAMLAGVEYAKDKSARQVSSDSHEDSRSWRLGASGRHLDVFIDSVSEEDWEIIGERCSHIDNLFNAELARQR
jgi:hypothetical protein